MKNLVYFDLETQKSASDVGGWSNARDMGMSIGVTYSTGRGSYRIYTEDEVDDLVQELQRADLVVGFNVVQFDYQALHGYTILDLTQIPTRDLMLDAQEHVGHRLSLDAIASATLGSEKTADGLQAIRWYQEGKLAEIAEYCCFDVKLTKMVHEFGAKNGLVFFKDRLDQLQRIPIPWRRDI